MLAWRCQRVQCCVSRPNLKGRSHKLVPALGVWLTPLPLLVQVRAWKYWRYPAADFLDVSVSITSVSEPPVAQSMSFFIRRATVGMLVGSLVAADEDSSTVLSYRLIAGDPEGAFAVSVTGTITVANPGLLSAGTTFYLSIDVFDGLLRDYVTVPITIGDDNQPPAIVGATFTIDEGSPVNSPVGTEPSAVGTKFLSTLSLSLQPTSRAPPPRVSWFPL
jgi:hypothetical protein